MSVLHLNLKTKILFLVSGTVLLSAMLQIVAVQWLTARQIEHATHDAATRAGSTLAEFLKNQRKQLKAQAELLVKQPALNASIETGDPNTVIDYLRDCLVQIEADGVEATDEKGRLLGQASRKKSEGKTNQWGEISATGLSSAMQGKVWTGITEKNGHILFVVTLPVMNSGFVKGSFTTFREMDTGIAKQFETSVGSPVVFLVHGQESGSSLPLHGATVSTSEKLTPLHLEGGDYMALYRRFPDTPSEARLGFAVLRSLGSIQSEYAPFKQMLLWGVLGVLIIAIASGKLMAQGILRPLDGFMNAAKVLQSGNYPVAFTRIRKDELGTLQVVFNEMTASLKSGKERLQALADADPLTGLLNHRRFQECLTEAVANSNGKEKKLSLLLFDLDHFHDFNQQWGHILGDSALCRIAETLQSVMPKDAILARYGGEEFAAFLPGYDLESAERVACEALEKAKQSPAPAPDALPVLFSVGCTEIDRDTAESEGLLLAAELAVSRAKQLGRGRVCRFEQTMSEDEAADPHHLQFALKDGSLDTIQALAAAVDAKDPYTQGHSRRVAEYASALGEQIGLSANEIDLIYTTGTLHDVGKIGVPDSILKKPSRMSEEEREVMETHPVLGEVIVRKAPQLAPTLPGVRNHHERWDGKGYPDKLAGNAIPFIARILAVADTYDAMTSDRPYRKGLSVEVALGEIAKGAGTQFDPALAPAFVEMMRAQFEALPLAA